MRNARAMDSRQLVHAIFDVGKPKGSSNAVTVVKPVETMELTCHFTPNMQLISRSHDAPAVLSRPVSSLDKPKRFFSDNDLTTLPVGVFDGLESLSIL